MRRNWLGRILRSVFTKLLVIVIVTGLCTHIALGAFFWMFRLTAGRPYQKTIHQYLSYIIADMGEPPQLARAARIARDASLQIVYQGPQSSWSTDTAPSSYSSRRLRPWTEFPNVSSGMVRRHFVVQVDHPQGRFVFKFRSPPGEITNPTPWHLALLLVISLILAGAYLTMRFVLKPINWLEEGVRQVGKGNLNHTVPVKGRDELRDLAEAFNEMTGRIRSMLRAKERLLMDVSHELRSPLTRVGVALEFMPEGRPKESIKADLQEMTHMISTILETARRHHAYAGVKLEPTGLNRLLQTVVSEFAGQSPGVILREPPAALVCRMDPPKMKTVLRNILANALKYSQPESRPVEISVEQKPPFAAIQIRDYGIGIPAGELEAIFEPFYRVDKSRSRQTGGYGLGLSLCKTIMDAHGGNIQIASSPGSGTTVCLFIPLTSQK